MKRVSLSPRIYALQGEELEDHVRENAGFVISGRGVVVIDSTRTLTDARWAYGQIRAVTDKKILYVINTHFHADHVFGNQLFDAPVIAHRLCRERMQELLQSDWSPEGLARQAAEQADPEALAGLRIVLPEIVFEGSLSLELGDLTLEILHLGGHTPGSSIVYLPQEEILYIGDLLFVKRYPAVIPGIVNTERWIAALERIEGMRIQTVVPGHGPVSTLEQVSHLKCYLRDLRERVGELARGGLSREEILSHPGFPRYAEKAYAASHQRNIGAVYDELFSPPSPS